MLDLRPDVLVVGPSCPGADAVSSSPATPATLLATPERVGRLADLDDLSDDQGAGAGPETSRAGRVVCVTALSDDVLGGGHLVAHGTGCSSSPEPGG
eukprot:6198062-Pyramimonas_sp.AAC.1